MDYAEKKRMPVDESKLKDLLRHQGEFKDRFNKEIGTYEAALKNPLFEKGILTYLNEGTYGEMNDLIKDIGISKDNLEFYNVGDLQKQRERLLIHPGDHNFNYLMNALFTPLDMTDYEDNFVSWREFGGEVPIQGHNLLKPL